MKELKPIRGKYIIPRLVEEGEHEHQDFKFAINDVAKIAHSISAFANHDGGRLLIGVKDNGNIVGVRNDEDVYVVEQAAQMFCKPSQPIKATIYSVEGAIVVCVDIAKSPRRPVMARENNGEWKAYYRVNDENIVVPTVMMKAWRKRDGNQGGLVSLNSAESKLLGFLDQYGETTIDEYVKVSHLSRATAEDVVVRLYSMQIIDFSYRGGEFKIVRATEN